MSSFLHNLLARSLGRADVVQPMIAPRFAASTEVIAGVPPVHQVLHRPEPQSVQNVMRADFVQPPVDPQQVSRASNLPQPIAHAQQPNVASYQPFAAPQITAQTQVQLSNAAPENKPSTHLVQPEVLLAPNRAANIVQVAPQLASTPKHDHTTSERGTVNAIEPVPRLHGGGREPSGGIEPAVTKEHRVAATVERTNAAQTRAEMPLPHEVPVTPTIQLTIGRIEVRAVQPAPTSLRRAVDSGAALSLDDYLRGRNGGQR